MVGNFCDVFVCHFAHAHYFMTFTIFRSQRDRGRKEGISAYHTDSYGS